MRLTSPSSPSFTVSWLELGMVSSTCQRQQQVHNDFISSSYKSLGLNLHNIKCTLHPLMFIRLKNNFVSKNTNMPTWIFWPISSEVNCASSIYHREVETITTLHYKANSYWPLALNYSCLSPTRFLCQQTAPHLKPWQVGLRKF